MFLIGFDFVKTTKNYNKRKYTAYTLAKESCPCNTCNTHIENLYKKDIYADV